MANGVATKQLGTSSIARNLYEGHNKLTSCFLDRIQFRTGSVGRQKKKKNLCS